MNPNNNKTEQVAQQVFDQNTSQNQFAVSQTPYHTHNGADSQRVNFMNLSNKLLVIPYTLFGATAATAANYSVFFTIPYTMNVVGITEVHTALGTDGGTVSLDVERLTGTQAPGSGTNITYRPFNLKGPINTVSTAMLSPYINMTQLQPGDRIALKRTGTLTSVANVTVTLIVSF